MQVSLIFKFITVLLIMFWQIGLFPKICSYTTQTHTISRHSDITCNKKTCFTLDRLLFPLLYVSSLHLFLPFISLFLFWMVNPLPLTLKLPFTPFIHVRWRSHGTFHTMACRKGHQSIPKILVSSSPPSLRSHVSLNESVACIPKYCCYGPPLQVPYIAKHGTWFL